MTILRIGLTGLSRTGKDEVCRILREEFDLPRVSLGDHIKRDMDSFIKVKFGFSAFTEIDAQKQRIRGLLIEHGSTRNEYFMDQMMGTLPERCVNSRLLRVEEAIAWIDAGGFIYEVFRPGTLPAEPTEARELTRMRDAGFITGTLVNSGLLVDLHNEVMAKFSDLAKA